MTDRTLCVRPTAKPSVLLDPIWSPYSRGKPNGLPRAGTALRLSSGLPATPMSTSRRQPEERGGVGDERVWRNGRRGRLKILLLPREVALQPRPPVSQCTSLLALHRPSILDALPLALRHTREGARLGDQEPPFSVGSFYNPPPLNQGRWLDQDPFAVGSFYNPHLIRILQPPTV